jgi:hypothetical protein
MRLDTPETGAFRLVVREASGFESNLGTGYFFTDGLQKRGGCPNLANNEQKSLYIQLVQKIDKINKERFETYINTSLCMLIPFGTMGGLGGATGGFGNNPIFAIGFLMSLVLPLAIIPWLPSVQNAEKEWAAKLDAVYEEAMPKWNDQGFRVRRVVDTTTCPKTIYLSFQKIEGMWEELDFFDHDDDTVDEETFNSLKGMVHVVV